jgi:hypothetical protein
MGGTPSASGQPFATGAFHCSVDARLAHETIEARSVIALGALLELRVRSIVSRESA